MLQLLMMLISVKDHKYVFRGFQMKEYGVWRHAVNFNMCHCAISSPEYECIETMECKTKAVFPWGSWC